MPDDQAPVTWDPSTPGVDADAMLNTLTATVRTITGLPDAQGRPGQVSLAQDVLAALAEPGRQTCGRAPVGVGKSLALLVPAMQAAALDRRRTVISTESRSLQNQIIVKDAPVVADAVEAATGYRPAVAVHKGWANYPCAVRVKDAAAAFAAATGSPAPSNDLTELARTAAGRPARGRGRGATTVDVGTGPVDRKAMRDLIVWAADALAQREVVSRSDYPGVCTDQMWSALSVTATECVGDGCPLFDLCAPVAAREQVAAADVVVTNHALLAIQAATSAPVVIGNAKVGPIHHVMVDEAHALADTVRSQGSGTVSGRRLRSLVRSAAAVLDETSPPVANLTADGEHIAAVLDETVGAGLAPGKVAAVETGTDPLDGLGEAVRSWCERLTGMLGRATRSADVTAQVHARRVTTRAEALRDDVATLGDELAGIARWVERAGDGSPAEAKVSPVEVAALLAGNLWTAPVPTGESGEPLVAERWHSEPGADGRPRYALSVVCVSGTLGATATRELGLHGRVNDYPSPFAAAYANSRLLVPKPTPAQIEMLSVETARGRRRMLIDAHRTWASDMICQLVDAAGGRALVLAATAASGRAYAEALSGSARGRYRVLSQWDGASVEQQVATWRAEESAVLVGTRSLMTGTDAPGMTNVLTVLDRVPRAPANPVDDARRDLIMERAQMNRWSADTEIYARDAALRIEQAAGRLIRSASDTGVVAVLDPRLLKSTPMAYPESTRKVYLGALAEFTNRLTSVEAACEVLAALVAASPAGRRAA
ncbi:ATP-dependent DNA helicase [Isoptericola croceus]|uniref:ATP-dependent DNA helicase n=1 Tax=Isoptericola croceus TaxID=3031406 RepID=UPI0023F7BC9B|nr:ATP-dependent DNA helicase [Isoptericola croceus]